MGESDAPRLRPRCAGLLDCEITWEKKKGLALGLSLGERIDRAEGTLYKGRAQRLLWDHENVRAGMVAESFIEAEQTAGLYAVPDDQTA